MKGLFAMQTKKGSMTEVLLNTFSGFIISLILTYNLLPQFGFEVTGNQSVMITAIYTVVSVIRSYLWRRCFNRFSSVREKQCSETLSFREGNLSSTGH